VINSIGPIISALAAVLFLIFAVVTFRARRADKRSANLAAIRDTNVAALDWAYRVRALAAVHGWELPPLPREMTPEYLAGKAEGDSNPELANLAQMITGLSSNQAGGNQ
jgi:hypothetical protein